jgi:hypothetical protein
VSAELRISSIPLSLKCPRVCECGCIQHDDFLLLIPPGGFNVSADGALVDGCLAEFPRHKGRNNEFLFFLFDYLGALILNRYVVWSTITPAHTVGRNCCPLLFLFFSVRVH